MLNSEPYSMGGITDYGISVSTKSSPRSVAFEKAQDELRQEYDVRDERRRELEFLEKGGNPLDFKFSHVASVSVQSTSLTDQIAEQNVISETKGSFAFTASPHGDSVESSGKLGSSICRETNTADNLMLFGGDNNDVVEKTVKRGTKRTNAAQPKQSLPTDGHSNAKKAENSGLPHLRVKNQAYVRRNRSKPSRESVNVASVRSSVVSSKDSEPKYVNGDHGVLSVSSKLEGSKCENVPKDTTSDEPMAMELDGIQAVHETHSAVKSEARQGDSNSKATEVLPHDVNRNHQLDGCGEIAETGASIEIHDATSKVVPRSPYSSTSTHNARETCADDGKVEDDQLDKSTMHIHVGKLDNSNITGDTLPKNVVNPPCEAIAGIMDKHADGNTNLLAVKIDGKSHEDMDISKLSNKHVDENDHLEGCSRPTSVNENYNSVQPEVSTTVHVKDEMEVCDNAIVDQKDTGHPSPDHSVSNERSPALERNDNCLGTNANPISVSSPVPKNPLPGYMPSLKKYESNLENEIKKSGEDLDNVTKKEHEDSILRKARLIEALHKRAGEPSRCNISLEKRRKGHWDFVLEEMVWMANDFMQERLWKSMAASQVCHCISSDGLMKFEEAIIQRKQKTIIRSLTKGIMSFWRLAEALRTSGRSAKAMQKHGSDMLEDTKPTEIKTEEQGNEFIKASESLQPRRSQIQDYAVRFLEYNCHINDSLVLAEAPSTPDRINDFGILKLSDQLSEENLFYTVVPGAMLAYRESMESFFMCHKKVRNSGLNDEYEISMCDSAADMAQENAYEDDGETCGYALPEAYDGGLFSKKGQQKKHLMQQRINGARPYEIGTDAPYEPCLESKSGNQPLLSNGKRPSYFLAVPTKRIRTAVRQRVVGPFPASVDGTSQVTSKTDVSSGDTNSYQDDQSSLHGGSLPWKNMDYESTVDFDRQLLYVGSGVSTKANKKKKHKNPSYRISQNAANSCASGAVKGRIYDQRSHVDLMAQYEQKDFLKKRSETKQFDSNGSIVGNGGQHASKKLKMMKQGDILQEASPVASQMSNMANPAKYLKILTNKDHRRKGKMLKMASSGGWSNFEDQALVVLVHDMGQNWELVSDAINSIVQFKSVYRQPKECKERHKVLVDKSSGDGAESAEDSGSSQHYHFTIPGIPKGSARQLFQRLQGPFEEGNLKAHFEKIIFLTQQVHSRCRQGKSQELKSIMQPHSSHVVALSQVCPNNLAGGTLTPLDLCDATSSNLDPIAPGSGYQGSHTNVLPNHHSSIVPTTTTSNLNSRLPGSSPGMVLGSNLPSPSTLSAPSRDAQKYGVPRSTSLQGDEQQKIQYNQMLSGRNVQQPGGSVAGAFPAGVDHGSRMLPGAHNMGMMTVLNRGMPAARAGFPRVSPPVMLNMASSGNVLPNSGQGVLNAVNVHPGAMPSPGNSMLRPRDPMQMLRPGQNMEEHMRVVMPEFHMQISQGGASTQPVNFSSSINPSLSSASALSPVQSFPVQQAQQSHQMAQPSHMFGNPHHSQTQATSHSSPQQQAYAMRMAAKERQIQQRMAPQQQNDLSGASAVPTVQNGSQLQQQNQTSAASSVPSSQPQHQRQQSVQNPPDKSALPNQTANNTQHKQKKQQVQQQPKQNQQRNQGSQQAKLMKSLGRGNMMIQTPPIDTPPASTVSTSSKKQVSDKSLVQHGQGFFPGNKASTSSMPPPGNQQKLYTSPLPPSPNQLPDIVTQGLMQGSPSPTLLSSQQPLLQSKSPLTTPPPPQQQQQRQINSSQNSIQRMMIQQNIQMKPDCRVDAQINQVQHSQTIPAAPTTQITESGSSGLPSTNHQKHEVSLDHTVVTSTSKLLSSPNDSLVGNETLLPPSSKDMLQRQISGGLPMHGQGIGSKWQQQQSRQHLQSPHQQQPQHQQRQVVHSSAYAPSNSGPG